MAANANAPQPVITEHDRSAAQTEVVGNSSGQALAGTLGTAANYRIGPRVTRSQTVRPYIRDAETDPLYRTLRIYTRDPTTSRLEGAVAAIKVPYEPLSERGPKGQIFHVFEREEKRAGQEVNLDEPKLLMSEGADPSPADVHFHQQMVYAVCTSVYSAFRVALGRHVAWGFDDSGRQQGENQLRIIPHVPDLKNANYNHATGELNFGYYRATPEDVSDGYLPGLYYTCLSHDIVAHEVTHALLDGLRAQFQVPCTIEVLAFHEAFADLVAIFQHFSYDQMLRTAIARSRGDLSASTMMANLAEEFGKVTGRRSALRTALENPGSIGDPPKHVTPEMQDRYEIGSILVSAVFEAFTVVFRRRAERYIKLATGGSGLIMGELSTDLVQVLASEASKLASHFLGICIRAIDYCPPVDIRLGDYLRAIITADFNLVPDDPYGYREAIVDAFRFRGLFPENIDHLSQDVLRWRKPVRDLPPITKLAFGQLRFNGDPQNPASAKELLKQASTLGAFITNPEWMDEFGIMPAGDGVELPCIESIRSSRRAGPDGQILFDLIAEVTQKRTITLEGNTQEFFGGSTIIIDPHGVIRYIISKSIKRQDRMAAQTAFTSSAAGSKLWERSEDSLLRPSRDFSRRLHED